MNDKDQAGMGTSTGCLAGFICHQTLFVLSSVKRFSSINGTLTLTRYVILSSDTILRLIRATDQQPIQKC